MLGYLPVNSWQDLSLCSLYHFWCTVCLFVVVTVVNVVVFLFVFFVAAPDVFDPGRSKNCIGTAVVGRKLSQETIVWLWFLPHRTHDRAE